MMPFFQITLRATDVSSATTFYPAVLGAQVPTQGLPLHEQAIARGARPHWLGFLARPAPAQRVETNVAWFLLNTPDVERAKTNYGELFGWEFQAPIDLGTLGILQPFAWERGGPPVGAMIDTRGRQGVSPHWLFYLGVPSLETAASAVQSAGGSVTLLSLPGGDDVALCEDLQGAAFGLRQTPRTGP